MGIGEPYCALHTPLLFDNDMPVYTMTTFVPLLHAQQTVALDWVRWVMLQWSAFERQERL